MSSETNNDMDPRGLFPKKWNRNTQYDDSYPDKAYYFLRKGKSKTALAAYLSVNPKTIYAWMKEHEAFGYAVECGFAAGQASDEDMLERNLENKDFNTRAYIFKMKVQYKLREEDKANILFASQESSEVDNVMRILSRVEREEELAKASDS